MRAALALPRRLGILDATAIVIGIVIGSGIFVLPNLIARSLPSGSAIIAVWVAAGVLSFFGALAYAELGAMLPATGGQYIFLREAYGPACAFVCGWTFMLAVLAGGSAWLAVTFARIHVVAGAVHRRSPVRASYAPIYPSILPPGGGFISQVPPVYDLPSCGCSSRGVRSLQISCTGINSDPVEGEYAAWFQFFAPIAL